MSKTFTIYMAFVIYGKELTPIYACMQSLSSINGIVKYKFHNFIRNY